MHEYYGLNVFPPNSCVEVLTPNEKGSNLD